MLDLLFVPDAHPNGVGLNNSNALNALTGDAIIPSMVIHNGQGQYSYAPRIAHPGVPITFMYGTLYEVPSMEYFKRAWVFDHYLPVPVFPWGLAYIPSY